MKKILLTGILAFCFQTVSAQDNVFSKSEQSYKAQLEEAEQMQTTSDPTDPNNPVPIDDYIPHLAIAGVVLAVYAVRKRRATV